MKYLNEILINWNNSDNSDFDDSGLLKVSDIKSRMKNYQLVYTLDKPKQIKLFDSHLTDFDKFKDKVYINNEHVELNERGFTENVYEPGEYEVYIDGFNKLNEIGYNAFMACSALTSITIPDSVTKIGVNAFFGCISLTEVTIPDSVKKISRYAFYYCKNLKTVYVEDIDKFNEIEFIDGLSDPRCYGAKLIELNK